MQIRDQIYDLRGSISWFYSPLLWHLSLLRFCVFFLDFFTIDKGVVFTSIFIENKSTIFFLSSILKNDIFSRSSW